MTFGCNCYNIIIIRINDHFRFGYTIYFEEGIVKHCIDNIIYSVVMS